MGSGVEDQSRHGILNPRAGEEHFTLDRRAPASDLAPFVDRHWLIRWDLTGRPPHLQETLPYPCVNVVIGTHRPGVHGVSTTRFVAHLAEKGWVVGTKFLPGGFRPFWHAPMSALKDRPLSLRDAFGEAGADLETAVHAAGTDDARVALVTGFFLGLRPVRDPDAERVATLVEWARSERGVVRVDALAERASVSVRTLQRLFDEYVGVPPKWVVRRFRVQEAAERARDGGGVDWAALAADLGYADQAHFVHDFKAQVGRTPTDYAAWCTSVERENRQDARTAK
jgi:AraC-like DNA-binding protein